MKADFIVGTCNNNKNKIHYGSAQKNKILIE